MMIERTWGSVGEWWFDGPKAPDPDRRTREHVRPLLSSCVGAAAVLAQHELLRVERVRLDTWLSPGTGTRVDQAPLEFSVPPGTPAGDLTELAWSAVSQVEGALYPATIELGGSGILVDDGGRRVERNDVAWIEGRLHVSCVVAIATQHDAWLPCSLFGRPQPEVHARNAPRLEAALSGIEARVGARARSEPETNFARIVGYRLENLRDEDGDVLVPYKLERRIEDWGPLADEL